MDSRKTIHLCLICLIAVGCSCGLETASDQRTTLKNAANIGSLRTRNLIIRLERGDKYSILELSGRPIALSLSKTEFQEQFPRLYEDFETAIADSEPVDFIMIDASF
jgi:hypothetical protein